MQMHYRGNIFSFHVRNTRRKYLNANCCIKHEDLFSLGSDLQQLSVVSKNHDPHMHYD